MILLWRGYTLIVVLLFCICFVSDSRRLPMTEENMNNENMLNEKLAQSSQLDETKNQQTIYILDTNILLHEPFAFLSFKEHDVVVPMTVLEELDSIKDRRKDVSRDARVAIRALEDILRDANPEQILAGVKLPHNDEQHPSGCLAIIVIQEVFINIG